MRIDIPFKTPTINHLYGQRGVRKYLKPEAKKLREEIRSIVQSDTSGLYDISECILKVHVKIFEDWFCKNGNIKRKDISNREKFLVDSIFDSLGIDDKMIFKHTMEKRQSTEEKCIVEIKPYG